MILSHNRNKSSAQRKAENKQSADGQINQVKIETPIVVEPPVGVSTPIEQAQVESVVQTPEPKETPKSSKQSSKDPVKFEGGFIIHDNAPMTPDISNSRIFHTDPYVPYVVHDKNIIDKNYKEISFPKATLVKKEQVFAHDPPSIPIDFGDASNPHILTSKQKEERTVEYLDAQFGTDIRKLVNAILTKSIDFEDYPIEEGIDGFYIVAGFEGMAPATKTTPFTLQTPNPKAISYLLQKILAVGNEMGFDNTKLMEVIKDMLTESTGVKQWLEHIDILWLEVTE